MNVVLVLATSGGGVGRHVAQIAAGLVGSGSADGHRVLVVGPAETDQDFGFSAAGVRFEPLAVAARPRPRADRRAVERLRGLVADADVVHAHGLRAGALTVLAVRRLGIRRLLARRVPVGRSPVGRRPKVIVTLHNALVSGGAIALVHGVLERIVGRGADVVLVVSSDLGTAIRRRGARDVRAAVVPAPVLLPPQHPAEEVRRELGVPPGTALLVTIARLAPQKGLDVLVAAVARLSSSRLGGSELGGFGLGGSGPSGSEVGGPGPVLAVVAGDGPLAEHLAGAAEGLPFRLLGRRADVADLLAAADLVVVPSRWEGQPLIVQEALLAGAAIVATDAGGTAAVAGDGAVLVPPGDPEALAAAIAALLADPAELVALRERARRRAQQLPSAEDALREVLAVYRSVLST